jgi:hypothetical protein
VKFLPANRVFRGLVVSNFHGTCGSEGVKGKYASECVTIVDAAKVTTVSANRTMSSIFVPRYKSS